MGKSADSQQPSSEDKSHEQPGKIIQRSYRSLYLIFYNSVSTVLWSVVLGGTLTIAGLYGYGSVHVGVGEFTKWTQTLAALEVVHAATGLVRAPLMTTLMQVASRFLLAWGIVDQLPNLVRNSPAYSTMLLAWSTSEVIRYSYFATNLAYGLVPRWLAWLRYNAFFVLYPLGIASECWLIWLARLPARRQWEGWEWVLDMVLFVYVPGSYILYTHMMAQRRKVLRLSDAKKAR